MPKKITHNEFIDKLKVVKPNLEVLSEYKGNKKYITVKCKIHDHTWQSKPNWLMHEGKYDCQKCYDERRGENTKIGLDEFITRAIEIHGDKYNYDNVIYVNNKTKIIITCPIHGDFITTPEKHINRHQGCPKCGNRNVTTDEFVEKAKKIHGNDYDYSKTNYINNSTKITIICKKHGEFQQTPDKHLSGHGCPICNESKLESLVRNILDKNNISYISQYKVNWLGKQSLDFYLPVYNIGIECQGQQHFNPVKYFGGCDAFKVNLKRDIIKNQLCEDNNVRLIYVTDLSKLKKSILNKQIFVNIYNNDNLICTLFKNINKQLLNKIL